MPGFDSITEEELKRIQSLCREWLSDPATNRGSRLTIPAGAVLPRAITIEIKSILTFDNMLIISAVDVETGLCYTKLIGKSGSPGTFIDAPLQMMLTGSREPAPENRGMSPTVREGSSRETEPSLKVGLMPRSRSHGDSATALETEPEPREFLLCSNGTVLGSSSLEKTKSARQRTGRFFPSDDYYEVAEMFEEFPTAENDWLEANVHEAYGLTYDNVGDVQRKFNELCERIKALKLYVADESGKQIATTEVTLEDLSRFYRDDSERWLLVTFTNAPPDER